MNENIKSAYLIYRNKSFKYSDTIERVFRKLSVKEDEYGKDLCMFNVKEIVESYEFIQTTSFNSLSNINSQILSYASWCLKNRKQFPELTEYKKNNYESIHSDDIHAIVGTEEASHIITRKQVLDMAKQLPNASDSFILLCLFEGIRGKDYSEIREIKWEDFNGNMLTLTAGRLEDFYTKDDVIPKPRTIEVSDELIYYANKARFGTMYTPLMDTENMTELADENFIVKRTEKARNCHKQPKLTRRVVEMLNYVSDGLSAADIRNSGKVHYVIENSKKKCISCKDYVFGEGYNDLCKHFDDTTQRQTFWNKYNSVLFY